MLPSQKSTPLPEGEKEVVLVAGAASGIGRVVCLLLLEQGHHVLAIDRDPVGLSKLPRTGQRLVTRALDVSDPGQWSELARTCFEQRLNPSRLVYAAGLLEPGLLCGAKPEPPGQGETLDAPTLVGDPDCVGSVRRLFSVHVLGLWLAARFCVPFMRERGEGAMVAVSSNAGSTPRMGMGVYPASKAAEISLVRCLALELGREQIRVNSVSPGSTSTPMLDRFTPLEARGKLVDGDPRQYRTGIPLGRIALPADVGDTVLFLLSERARHITAQDLCVDGGATWG